MFRNHLRSIALVLTIASLLSLCGCFYFRYDQEDLVPEDVRSIQFYDICEAEEHNSEAVLSEEPFYTLPTEQHEAFLKELRKLRFQDVLILFAASDPSFSYGDYVLRIDYHDGTFKLLSCGGYNETFDKNGKQTGGDHYACDAVQWNDLIYSFAGERSSRIYYRKSEHAISVEDHLRLTEILQSAEALPSKPECTFDDDDYIKNSGKEYYLAEEGRPIIRVEDTYFEITEQERDELYTIIQTYLSYWRYSELNES